ncbi:uncharacterized protein BDZ99DRAFT_465294 [Mytilinidion resinicola]|uniref:Cytochrome c oxidase assembly protein PET191 n=1 Tax=Mytilinidion resinicola TaxID=574789 RepID=A0A6A6YFV4_9PEZI|nr:uncharacterized protein BDZ99DRAFT_465294 [Mytilinidion resinicola]KAF2807413.1 hypothetical protein BDZ99DRAFT_465294 [Mytilinidion resinicola]
MIDRHAPSDCLRPPLNETLPTQCQQLQKGYGQCKRGMIDMRKRFRGNRPVGLSTELEGAGSGDATVGTIEEKGYMLYAGKPTQRVRVTSGDEGPNVVPEGYVEVRKKDGVVEVVKRSGELRKD